MPKSARTTRRREVAQYYDAVCRTELHEVARPMRARALRRALYRILFRNGDWTADTEGRNLITGLIREERGAREAQLTRRRKTLRMNEEGQHDTP